MASTAASPVKGAWIAPSLIPLAGAGRAQAGPITTQAEYSGTTNIYGPAS